MIMVKTFLTALLLAAVLFSAGAANGVASRQINKTSYYSFNDILRGNRIGFSTSGKLLRFRNRFFSGELNGNSRKGKINGIGIEFNHAVSMDKKNDFFISALDWRTTIRPLCYPGSLPRQRVRRITLDMGHGGDDPGAMGKFSKEKNINLTLGLLVAKMLRRQGFEVCMTRQRDVRIPLSNVGKLQNSHRSDLFVSIHVNSAQKKSVSGVETYCLTPAGVVSANSKKLKKNSEPGNRFDPANTALAYFIQRNLIFRTGAEDRGVKRANFAVLRDLNAPGVLIEIGFISNEKEERLLNSPAYLSRLALGIVGGIMEYQRAVR